MASLFRRDPEILLAATAQTVSASATLVAVTSLTTRVLTAGTYCFDLNLDMTQTGGLSTGYKVDFGGGTAVFSAFLMNAQAANVAAGTNAHIEAERDTSATEGGLAVGTNVTPLFYRINGAFTVSTAGTFAPRFAQQTGTGGTTCSVTALSTLRVRKTG